MGSGVSALSKAQDLSNHYSLLHPKRAVSGTRYGTDGDDFLADRGKMHRTRVTIWQSETIGSATVPRAQTYSPLSRAYGREKGPPPHPGYQ